MTAWIWMLGAAQAISVEEVADKVSRAEAHSGIRLAQVPKIPHETMEKVVSGEIVTEIAVVDGYKAKKAYGVGIVPVDIGRFWSAINDNAGKARVSKLGYAETLEGEACSEKRVVFQYLPVSLATDRWWVIDQLQNGALSEKADGKVRELYWKSRDASQPLPSATAQKWADQGMPLAFTEGAWLLVDLDGKNTLVHYYTWSDPGGMVPAGIATSFAAGSIKDTFEKMTELARSGAACPTE